MVDPGKWRIPFGAALVAMLALSIGAAKAVEFDEKLRAPMVTSGAEFRTQAESFKSKLAAVQAGGAQALLTDDRLSALQLDLLWQVQRMVDSDQFRNELEHFGFRRREDGSYAIDYAAHPEWLRFDYQMAGILPKLDVGLLSAELRARGFRESDLAVMQEYFRTHDSTRDSLRQSLPLAIGFSKLVKKHDKLKLKVSDNLVMSYLYQRKRADAVAQRAWVKGLFNVIDPQSARILVSYFAEMPTTAVIGPDDQRAGIDELLRRMRLADFDRLATLEANGGAL